MKKIRITSIILSIFIAMSAVTANASVLGSSLIDGYSVEIGEGITATYNQWYSDQEGVGQQTENYLTYLPNSDVEPIITGGEYVYGRTTIENEIERIRNLRINPIAGTNADFFSLQTGVPMSNVIVDGKILTKDGTEQYGIGILDDNTAFMSKFTIHSVMTKEDGSQMNIYNINKYRQPYAAYLMTDEFSTETHNNTKGFDVVLGSVEGELKIGSEITATVESVDEYEGSIAIPEGKLVLTVDSAAPEEFLNPISTLQIGEKITISFGVTGDERWKDAKLGLGATGGMLIENGEVNTNFEAGANPRTALGIKKDGSLLLYTIDGRKKGYSYGVQLKTLANRLKELGCVDAINLDGGGSTCFVLQFPGDSNTTLNNKPSDGKSRAVSNFIFFKNNLKPTGILNKLTVYPLTSYVLTGASVKITTKATDTAYYPVKLNGLPEYTVEENSDSTVDENGIFTAKDSKAVTVYATKNNITGSTKIVCLDTPTDIVVKAKDNDKNIKELKLKRGESINLYAESYAGYNKLIDKADLYTWSCDEEIGTITENGTFTSADVLKADGNIYVTAGKKTVTIPVNITRTGNESADEMYTEINCESLDNDYTISLSSQYGITVAEDGIIVKVDGSKIPFEYADNQITFTVPEGTTSVTVFVKNSEGLTSFYTDKKDTENGETPFNDTEGHWAQQVISNMYRYRIVNGENTNDGLKFNPNKSMTRSEFAVMITNYLGINTANYENTVLPYEDADEIAAWAENSFKALYELGIIKGVIGTDGKLYANPVSSITRAETATIISRTLPEGIKVSEIISSDIDEIAEWAYDGIGTLITLNAINGYEDGTIRPLRNVTKSEAAKILFTII